MDSRFADCHYAGGIPQETQQQQLLPPPPSSTSTNTNNAIVVPPTTTTANTGAATTRGTMLFSRPDWRRPWRTSREQEIATLVAQKEEEIEHHLNRNNDLRVQLAKASSEIQRMSSLHARDRNDLDLMHKEETRRLEVQIAELRNELEREKNRCQFNIDALRLERDEAVRTLTAQLHTVQANTNDTCVTHIRQLQDVREAAQREVALNVKMCDLKNAELMEDLTRMKAQLEASQKLRESTIKEMQNEMKRQQDIYLEQIRESQRRVDALRISYQEELTAIGKERDTLRSQVTKLESDRVAQQGNIRDAESRIMDWNTRILSELDQLYEFYIRSYSDEGMPLHIPVLDDVRRHAAAVLFSPVKRSNKGASEDDVPVAPLDKTPESEASATVVRILDRLHALNSLRSQHQDVINKLMIRIRNLEAQTAESTHAHRSHSEHLDTLLNKLQADVSLVRGRQDRLQDAVEEARSVHLQSMQHLKENEVRLEFFLQDARLHDKSKTQGVSTPPSGTVTFVVTGIQGGATQMEKNPGVFRGAMSMLNETLRATLQAYGGYEAKSHGDSFLLAFSDPIHAAQFSLELQMNLMKVPWSDELLKNFDSSEVKGHDGTVLFRGLRVACAIHTGEVCIDENGIYFGGTVTHAVALAAHTCGGQILLSGTTWLAIRDELNRIGNPAIVDLQEHRLSPSDLFLRVVQILPHPLRDRGFTSILERKAMGVVYGASEFIRLSTQAQVQCCKSLFTRLDLNVTTIHNESHALTDMVKAVGTRLREMQVSARVYTAADIVTTVASLDRVSSRLETVAKDTSKSQEGQNSLANAIRVLEESFVAYHRSAMSDEEFRRRISLLQERSQESLHEQHLAHEHTTQQLRNVINRLEGTIGELRSQLSNGTVEALQNQITKERSRHEQMTKEYIQQIQSISAALAKERMLTRFQNVPRCAEAIDKENNTTMNEIAGSTTAAATNVTNGLVAHSPAKSNRSMSSSKGSKRSSSTHTTTATSGKQNKIPIPPSAPLQQQQQQPPVVPSTSVPEQQQQQPFMVPPLPPSTAM
eukprot:PhF_6_TR44195/c1_g1_i4/m.67804